MLYRNHPPRRCGVAAVELGFVTILFMVPMMIAIWDVGRLIHVKQIVANSAREGARLAAQGFTITSSGTQVQICSSSSSSGYVSGTPNVTETVVNYLQAAGLTQLQSSDVTVTFAFTSAPLTSTDPYQGLKGQTFTVYVSIPWSKVQWTTLGLVNPSTVQYTVTWQMLVDSTFTVNPNLPPW